MNALTSSASSNSRAQRGLEIAGFCSGFALAVSDQAIIPLWIGATTAVGSLSTVEAGQIASAELLAMALGALLVTAIGVRHLSWRASPMAAAVAVAANLMAMCKGLILFAIARSLSGLSIGILMAIVTPLAACRPDGQRVMAIATGVAMVAVSAIYLGSNHLTQRFGVAGVFAIMAGIALLTVIALGVGLRSAQVDQGNHEARRNGDSCVMAAIACLGFAIVSLGQMSIFAMIVVVSRILGFSTSAANGVLAGVLPISALVTIAAHVIGQRSGLVKPAVGSLLLLGADILLLARVTAIPAFFGVVLGLNFLYLFFSIYALALMGRFDQSGRFVSASGFLSLAASAVGTALGSKILVDFGVFPLALFGASCVLVGIVLFCIVPLVKQTSFLGNIS